MKRRDILIGGAALGLAPEAGAATREPEFDPARVESALERVDQRMASLATMDLSTSAPKTVLDTEIFASRARLARAAARTLYFTGAFMEFDEHERLHPGVQERMRRLQPEVDEAVDGLTSFIESLGPSDCRALQEAFRRDPDLATRVGEQLQQVAKDDGFGFSRRVDLRLAVADLGARIRTQNASLLLDPIAQKVRRIQANPKTDEERERVFAIRAGEKAFWEFQQRSAQAVATWDLIYANRAASYLGALPDTYPSPPEVTPQEKAQRLASADQTKRTGFIVMGIGAGTLALGGIFYLIGTTGATGFGTAAVVLGVTVGPLLLVIGLIILIVGLVNAGNAGNPVNDRNDKDTE
jgi:hypothetical protein